MDDELFRDRQICWYLRVLLTVGFTTDVRISENLGVLQYIYETYATLDRLTIQISIWQN